MKVEFHVSIAILFGPPLGAPPTYFLTLKPNQSFFVPS